MIQKQGLYGWIAWSMFRIVHRQLSRHNDSHERENRVRALVRKRAPAPGDIKHPDDSETALIRDGIKKEHRFPA